MFKREIPTNETEGKFVCTSIRREDGGEGDPVAGASFLYDDGKQRAVFHSLRSSNGRMFYTGLVPGRLKAGSGGTTIDQSIAAVMALN